MAAHKKRSKANFMNEFLDETYHPNNPICQIIPTNTTKKKNIFDELRPASYECLDYNISQTDAKLDAGDTKIHIQQTTADYVYNKDLPPPPPRPPRRKNKYFSGGAAQWKFIDEIWREKQEDLQKVYHKEFKIRVTERKGREGQKMNMGHDQLMRLVGPAWYQELSPKQIATVDKLKHAIYKDFFEGTIINVKENIGELGLVLRPNQAHLKKALKHCCNSPVEFLLILYQIMNPHRKHYTINDRLLLSAVVHLTMTSTLRELHIRIPSPPRPVDITKVVPLKKKRKKYESPYLQKLTFVRDPPKFSGIYRNKHVQRPQSPYFCYLKELKKKASPSTTRSPRGSMPTSSRRGSMPTSSRRSTVTSTNTKTTVQEQPDWEIDEELVVAQRAYENLVDFKPVPTLLKPSRYAPCINFRNPIEPVVPDQELPIIEDTSPICQVPEEKHSVACSCAFYIVPCEPEIDPCEPPPQLCDCAPPVVQTVCPPIVQTVAPADDTCDCNNREVLQNTELSCQPPQTHHSKRKRSKSPEVEKKEPRCKHEKDLQIYNEKYHLIRPKSGETPPCRCKEKRRKTIDEPLCPCELCEEERRKKNQNFVITGLSEQPEETINVIDRVVLGKPCKCLKKYEQEIEKYEAKKEEEANRPCSCRKEVTEFVETSQCQCEKCQEERRKKAVELIIAGTKETEDENLPIIEGISTGRPCKCVQQYEKRANEYEDFQKRKRAVVEMKEHDDKFAISGISMTPKGPQFVISGMRPPIDCACAKKAREEEERRLREEMMPHIPGGRLQYSIAGVKETPTGSVYILGATLPINDCDCETVYKTFKAQHFECTRIYDEFLLKMKEDYDEFVEEMGSKNPWKSVSDPEIAQEEVIPEVCLETIQETEVADCGPKPKSVPAVCCPCVQKRVEKTQPAQPVECPCKVPVAESIECIELPEEPPPEVEEIMLKRFFIFDKIRCDRKWQQRVIKKALESMADDDFPLAKLPDCHKLPHFKLWMQMRCHKFWTKEDRYKYIHVSKCLWGHCEKCNKYPTIYPTLNRAAGEGLNWAKADYCRQLVNTTLEKFYRTIKQNRINGTREWFPTTFSYEFPFKHWRDCYFAYCDSKEEEVHARFVWQKYEFNNVADAYRKKHR